MRREDFEHIIGSAAELLGENEFVVIGSQSIHGSTRDPPGELLESMEVDMYPRTDPDRADEFEGVLGDGSYFHSSFGYYAHAVGPETAKAPAGWEDRLIRVEVPPRYRSSASPVALCLEPHDLVLAKLARGSERDWTYAKAALRGGLVRAETLLRLVASMPLSGEHQEHLRRNLSALVHGL